MISKSINLQKVISLSETSNPIAYLNAQIGVGYSNMSISLQVADKQSIAINKDLFLEEYKNFMEAVMIDATNNGWEVFKEDIEEEVAIEEEPVESE